MENADKALPIVEVELGGKKHQIKCSFGVFWRFQKLSGKDPFKNETYQYMNVQDYVNLMAACLYPDKNDPPENHIEEVAEMMGTQHIETLTEVVRKLFRNQAPEGDGEKKAEMNPHTTPMSQ